ncbi:NAD(P)-dependent oxidoreductase [Clostridium sp.]
MSVFLVNTAIGTIVDTKALIEALDSGKVAAEVIDTYKNGISKNKIN